MNKYLIIALLFLLFGCDDKATSNTLSEREKYGIIYRIGWQQGANQAIDYVNKMEGKTFNKLRLELLKQDSLKFIELVFEE